MHRMQILCLLLISSICMAQQDFDRIVQVISHGTVADMVTIFDSGINPNIQNLHGDTALIQAVLYGRADCVKLLVEKGVDPQIKNEHRWTALQLAEFRADLFGTKNEVVAILKSAIVKK